MTVGDRIKMYRVQLNLTQEAVASKIGTTKQNIYKYENNIVTNIPLDNIEKLAALFLVNPCDLMGWNDGKEPITNHSDGLSTSEHALVSLFRMVPKEQQHMIVGMVEAALKSQELL